MTVVYEKECVGCYDVEATSGLDLLVVKNGKSCPINGTGGERES